MSKNTHQGRVWIRSEHDRGAYAVRRLRTLSRQYLQALKQRAELSIIVTTDAEIQRLNREWRKKNKPTDVLSFPQDPASGMLGDIVISLDTARAQAAEGKRPLSDELARLLAHGILHLLGHDHEEPAEAKRMAQAEARLLGKIGMVAEALDHPANLTMTRARVSKSQRHKPAPKSKRGPGRHAPESRR